MLFTLEKCGRNGRTDRNHRVLPPNSEPGARIARNNGVPFASCVPAFLTTKLGRCCYRAEIVLAQLAREKLKRFDDARSLIRQLFRTEVDLIPDQQNKTLTVRLHSTTTQAHDEIVRHICTEITATETVVLNTDLRLIYEISGLG